MTMLIDANPVPLRADPDGAIRLVGTRLTLDVIVTAYRDGAPAEQIADRFPGVSLSDVYGVIGYYLRHRQEVEAYLESRSREAESIRQEIEAGSPPELFRDQLLARRPGM